MGRPPGRIAIELREDWKVEARAALKGMGKTIAAVAADIGCEASNVSKALLPVGQGGYATSAYAADIARIAGVPLPRQEPDGPMRAVMANLDELRHLNPRLFDEEARAIARDLEEEKRLHRAVRERAKKK